MLNNREYLLLFNSSHEQKNYPTRWRCAKKRQAKNYAYKKAYKKIAPHTKYYYFFESSGEDEDEDGEEGGGGGGGEK